MTQADYLRPLHKRLARLRGRRQRFRWATAASALVVAVLWALAAVFALDWIFQRNIDVWQRLVLTLIAAGGVAWAVRRYVLPWLGKREDETDMALLVQDKAHIDSDLVAALQFESPDAARWGSVQLEREVISRMAARQGDINVMAAMPREPLAFRAKLLAATLVLWACLGIFATDYVSIFFRRLAFGSQHYPTQTDLLAVKVNGKEIDLAAPGDTVIHVPFGQAVRFEVTAAGAKVESGRVELTMKSRSEAEIVPLDVAAAENSDGSQGVYRGNYDRLNQSAQFKVILGDAWTDAFALSVVPLPVMEIEPEVVPPVYARHSADEVLKLPRGMRQFPVLLGSEVRLKLHTDRPLKSARVKIGEKTYAMRRDAGAAGQSEELWSLPAAGTPLAAVAAEVPYAIEVIDAEGQVPDKPLDGMVTIEQDQPPQIAASTKAKVVLPTATPRIHYEASDDHALNRIWLTWEATSSDTSKPPAARRQGQVEIARFPPSPPTLGRTGDYAFALQSLGLAPGDTLKMTFHASDYRGPVEPATSDSDPPLVFQVTDLHGFEASMYEADQKSAEALETIRKEHTGEESP